MVKWLFKKVMAKKSSEAVSEVRENGKKLFHVLLLYQAQLHLGMSDGSLTFSVGGEPLLTLKRRGDGYKIVSEGKGELEYNGIAISFVFDDYKLLFNVNWVRLEYRGEFIEGNIGNVAMQ